MIQSFALEGAVAKSVSVLVPALNEEENVGPTVERLREALKLTTEDYEIIVVNDGSTDRTGEVINQLAVSYPEVRALHNPHRMGLGYCYVRGCEEARKNFFVYIPGDNTWPLHSFVKLLESIGQADVITSYAANPEVRPAGRRWVSRLYTQVINMLFGYRLHYYNGLTIYPVEFLKLKPVSTFGFGFQAEVLLHALFLSLSYVEVCIPIDERTSGGSKAVNTKNIASVLKTVAYLVWKLRVRRNWPDRATCKQMKVRRATLNRIQHSLHS